MTKAIILAVVLLMAGFPAHAGTITISVGTASGACAGNACAKSYTASDADIARIVPAYQVACNAQLNAPCSQKQVLAYWADQVIAGVVVAVSALEKQTLQDNATSGYTPIKPQ